MVVLTDRTEGWSSNIDRRQNKYLFGLSVKVWTVDLHANLVSYFGQKCLIWHISAVSLVASLLLEELTGQIVWLPTEPPAALSPTFGWWYLYSSKVCLISSKYNTWDILRTGRRPAACLLVGNQAFILSLIKEILSSVFAKHLPDR